MNFNLINIAGLALVIISAILMTIFRIINRAQPYQGLRSIPAFNRLRQAIGLAVEDGSRVHVSLGNASPYSQQSASALVGLSVLDRITQLHELLDDDPIEGRDALGIAQLNRLYPFLDVLGVIGDGTRTDIPENRVAV